jgi:exopolyphosphatase/guanosine-5'-triphosphate,3'-diphosphate pyrophosphatase
VGPGAGRAEVALTVASTFATIDIGTNTVVLLIARVAQAPPSDSTGASTDDSTVEPLAQRAEITRLGRGIGGAGRLGQAGIDATLEVLRQYAALARSHGAHIVAVGTEALRRAANADDLLLPAAQILGVPVEVIDGQREAALTFRAALQSFPAEARRGTLLVVDIGGGSTEIIIADRGQVRFRASLALGSVRLTERHVKSDPPREEEIAEMAAEIAAGLAAVPFPAPADHADVTVVGVAGTVTSLAAMTQELALYDPAQVHGFTLGRGQLDAQIARLSAATQSQREVIVGLDPRRADVILAGALILREIARRAGVDAIRVSDRGIRWGLLYEQVAATDDRRG